MAEKNISVAGVDGNSQENKQITIRQPYTKKEQYEKIMDFYREHNEELMDKVVFNEMWKSLTAELNNIGPPAHTEAEWKRKWSVHKYNMKKKRKSSEIAESLSHLDDRSHSTQTQAQTFGSSDFHSEILERLDEISETQDVMIQNQNALKESQEKSNKMLEDIAMKLNGFELYETDGNH